MDADALASLAAQKEREWRDAVGSQTKALEKALGETREELAVTKSHFEQLKDDFKVCFRSELKSLLSIAQQPAV